MTRRALPALAGLALLALGGAAQAATPAGDPEARLLAVLKDVNASRLDRALAEVESLIRSYPNFRLAHLVRGDLLLARARPLTTLGNVEHATAEELRDEARARILRAQEPSAAGRVPRYLLQMNPEQRYAVVADTSRARLYLYENAGGEPQRVADYYISSGKNGAEKFKEGDQKTPIGVYFVTANLPRQKLTDFYGSGAFPISYPNEWDRRQGRNGHGIWLHGTPSDTYSRPPRASNGCVVLTNDDLDAVAAKLQVGLTPVVITSEMEWTTPEALRAERASLTKAVEAWRRDWESRDSETYLRHYAKGFSSGNQDLAQWAAHKREVNARKSWIKVKLSNLSMFAYPGRDNLVVVTFEQDYASSNLSNKSKKRQYWSREGNSWRIVYEGGA